MMKFVCTKLTLSELSEIDLVVYLVNFCQSHMVSSFVVDWCNMCRALSFFIYLFIFISGYELYNFVGSISFSFV